MMLYKNYMKDLCIQDNIKISDKNLDIYFKIWEMHGHISSLQVIWLLALLLD